MDTDGPTPRARKQAVLVGVQRPKHGNNIGGAPGAYKDVQHLRDLLVGASTPRTSYTSGWH